MKKTNVFIKPSGKAKGSQTMGAKGDIKGQGKSISNPSMKAKVMGKVMSKYPNTYGTPNPSKVVKANQAAQDVGTPISQQNNPRSLKYIGK